MHAIHEGLRGIGSVRHLRSGPAGEELVAKVILRTGEWWTQGVDLMGLRENASREMEMADPDDSF